METLVTVTKLMNHGEIKQLYHNEIELSTSTDLQQFVSAVKTLFGSDRITVELSFK